MGCSVTYVSRRVTTLILLVIANWVGVITAWHLPSFIVALYFHINGLLRRPMNRCRPLGTYPSLSVWGSCWPNYRRRTSTSRPLDCQIRKKERGIGLLPTWLYHHFGECLPSAGDFPKTMDPYLLDWWVLYLRAGQWFPVWIYSCVGPSLQTGYWRMVAALPRSPLPTRCDNNLTPLHIGLTQSSPFIFQVLLLLSYT